MAKAPKAKSEVTESGKVAIINAGVALIFIDGEKLMPGDEMEVSAELLKTSGIEYLFGQGALEIKDDRDATDEIRERMEARRKPDPTAGKSQKELEDGGEF